MKFRKKLLKLLHLIPTFLIATTLAYRADADTNCPNVAITPLLLGDATINQPYTQTLTATRSTPVSLWNMTGSMSSTRRVHTVTALPNDKVIAVGGENNATADVYDPNTETWTAIPNMSTVRWGHTATVLSNGTLLVTAGSTGGYYIGGTNLVTAEIYDPGSNAWTLTGSLTISRFFHTATLLQNGKVLVAGGEAAGPSPIGGYGGRASCELYDPATGQWSATGSMIHNRSVHTATLLQNGKVLVAGGDDGDFGATTATAELYDPAAGTWSETGTMAVARTFNDAVLLLDGRVFIAGNGSSEIYDPATGTWGSVSAMIQNRTQFALGLLPDGQLIAAGASNGAELYDPTTQTWTPTGSMNVWRQQCAGIVLTNGELLVCGGYYYGSAYPGDYQPQNTAEVFNPQSVAKSAYTFAVTGGGLPDGLSLSSNGVVSGTPTTAGSNTFTVSVTDGFGCGGSSNLTLFVKTPATVTLGNLDQTYDGAPKSVSATTDPAGLQVDFSYNGSTNQPVLPGAYTVVGVINDPNYIASSTNQLVIECPPTSLAPGSLTDGYLGQPYMQAESNRTWTSIGTMTTVRDYGSTAALLPDGRVFVAGGDISYSPYTSSSEIYDAATGVWTNTGFMTRLRREHSMTVLRDGSVLVIGGKNGDVQYTGDTELWDPNAPDFSGWSQGASMDTGRGLHSATLLQNGRVLISGGQDLNGPLTSCLIYDPSTDEFLPTGSFHKARYHHQTILLPNGKVLAIGGIEDAGPNVESYDQSTGKWTVGANWTAGPLYQAAAILMNNGKVLVIGGLYVDSMGCEIYDPVANSWTGTGELNHFRHDATPVLLPDGRVLVANGQDDSGDFEAEIYDPATGVWTEIAPLNNNAGQVFGLKNGLILACGDGGAPSELYGAITLPGASGLAPFTDTLTSGALPNGLAVDQNGVVSGTARITGIYTFGVTAANPYGCSASANFTLAVGVSSFATNDTINPTVTINTPTNNAAGTNAFLHVTGNASDDIGVASVLYSVNGGSQQVAQTANSFTSWTSDISLNPGTNTFSVQSVDFAGNASPVVIYQYVYTYHVVLSVEISGSGKVAVTEGSRTIPIASKGSNSFFNAFNLISGHTYTATAKPAANNAFSNWVDRSDLQTLSTSAKYSFVVSSNGLALRAAFVTNPIVAASATGTYNGLFAETNGVAEQSAGALVNLIVRSNRTYSGKLMLAGTWNLFSGTFDLSGNDTQTIGRGTKPSLEVSLHLDLLNGTKQVTGTVSCESENWTSPLLADLDVYNAAHHYSPAHRYTLAIPPAPDAPTNSPSGYGCAAINVTATGMVSVSGKLADNTPVTLSVPISKDGNAPVHVDLYHHTGLLQGWISFASGSPTGALTWIAPAGPGPNYGAGFTQTVNVIGSAYTPASAPLGIVSGTLTFADGLNSTAPLNFDVAINNGTISKAPATITNKLTGSITTGTGLVSFNFRPTGGPANQPAFGVVLQNTNAIYGGFYAPSRAGSVDLH